ncbi:MAG: sugar ABC transporter substrate-binding protein [Acidobacteria bacterium]|nr:MAG: sugar ABC transporter substrate-binding protein [Acidobacteriota bacterium]
MTRSRITALVVCTALIAGLIVSQPSSGLAQKQPTVGLVTINLQALFFNQVNQGAQDAANKNGVKLAIVNGNNDPAAQVSAVEDFVQQKVSAIVVLAIDVKGIVPALREAAKAKIPVIAIDALVEDPSVSTFIGTDNPGAGEQIGRFLVSYVNANMGGKATVGVVGALNSFIQNQRRDGFLKAVKASPGIKVVATVDGQNVQERALAAGENLVTANPSMNVIYATGEPAIIGSIAAVQSQNATRRIKIVGWDLAPQVIKAIDDGYVVGVVQQGPEEEGRQAVLAALKLSKGQTVPKKIFVPVAIVTKENVDKFRGMFK